LRLSTSISLHRVLSTLRPLRCYQHDAAGQWQVVTLIAGTGSKRRSLLMAGDDDEIFMIRSFDVTPKSTEQHLIVRSGESEAAVSNNRRGIKLPSTVNTQTNKHTNRGKSYNILIFEPFILLTLNFTVVMTVTFRQTTCRSAMRTSEIVI